MRFLPGLFLLFLLPAAIHAQNGAIGQWRSHYPYNILTGIATDGDVVYATSDQGFFSYRPADGAIVRHSKADGMTDAGTDKIGYDTHTETVLITYRNGNIDLYRNGSFYNIPSIRLRPSNGSKAIVDVYCADGLAYLSTAIGAVVLDLQKQEVRENYVFYTQGGILPINALRPAGNFLFAATPRGLYRAPLTGANLQDFSVWQQVLEDSVKGLALTQQQLWLHTPTGVLKYNSGAAADTVFRSSEVAHIDPAIDGISVTQVLRIREFIVGRVRLINHAGTVTDSFRAGYPLATVQASDGAFYTADSWEGMLKRTSGFNPAPVVPPGPAFPSSFHLEANNRQVRVLHGAYNQLFQPIGRGGWVSTYDGSTDVWKTEQPFGPDVKDLVDCLETDSGTWYGAMSSGLFLKRKDGTTASYTSGVLEPLFDDASGSNFGILSMTKDLSGNLIFGQYKPSGHDLVVRTPGGQWVYYAPPAKADPGGFPRTAAGLLVDDYNQIWWFQPQGGGVYIYNNNNTPENTADDKSAHLGAKKGNGGLPSAAVLSMAKDRDGNIWIGTINGMAVVSCPGSVIGGGCEATQPTLKLDQFAGLLFDNEQVNTIAIDGANRKWVGTTNGVWLITADAQQVVERFTVDNSPLPSNVVQRIAIDDVTGDVYMGTANGLVSYRGTATAGDETEQTVRVFPNPVRSDYRGPIAFANLPADADVRITDISGQLVYRATATGGQAVWNGMDYTGKRPQTGVYLVFVTSKDGTLTTKGKFVFAE